MRYIIFFIFFILPLYAFNGYENYKIYPKSVKNGKFMSIQFLDSKILKYHKIDGLRFYGLSSLAYDKREDILYGLNDRGMVYSFKIVINHDKIQKITPLHGYRLRDENGKKLLKPKSDSEGMTIFYKDEKLRFLISFERRPRIIEYSKKFKAIKSYTLPKVLENIKNYQGKNSQLESVTYSSKYGYITASEFPLKHQKSGYQSIYDKDGEICKFKKDYFDNAVVELESIKDGNLLVLQRDFNFLKFNFNTTLKKVYLHDIKNGVCKSKNLAVLKSSKGWKIDNFEGVTKLTKNLYLMISDDNNNLFQKTILTLFKIIDLK